ncbi:MAG TPA: hypothetical protein VLC53_04790, partial [Myxococcota bacterium]|nr:hypothetical protein [Myxococcota bacterium]
MPRRLAALLAGLALGGCAAPAPGPGAFAFGVTGDTPYSDAEERAFEAMLARTGTEDLAFVVHVGDFKGAGPCSDALFERRRRQFDASAHPFVFTPGDNDWVDCRRASRGGADPLERLARLRQVFFADGWSLGRRRLALESQDRCLEPPAPRCGCAAHPENRAWEISGVRFVTLNLPGSNDNTGFDARNDEEARCRGEANRRWLAHAVAAARAAPARALVVMVQANPFQSR